MNIANQKSIFKQLFDGASVIAIATGTIYFCNQVYLLRISSVLKFPSSLLKPSIDSIVSFLPAFIPVILMVFVIVAALFHLIKTYTYIPANSIFLLVILQLTITMGVVVNLIPPRVNDFSMWIVVAFHIIIIMLILSSSKWKFANKEQVDHFSNPEDFLFFFKNISYIAIVLLLFMLSWYTGTVKFRHSSYKCYTFKGMIVVGQVDERIICKPYSQKTGILSDSVIVVKLPDATGLKFTTINNLKLDLSNKFTRIN